MNFLSKSLLIFVLSGAALLSSCKKESDGSIGPAGPQGTQGPQGPRGVQGPQGESGNANVTMYTYGSRTFAGSVDYLIPNITQGHIDSSLIVAYYNPSTESSSAWYPVPGMGPSNLYNTRNFHYLTGLECRYSVRLLKPDGSTSYTTSVTFTKFKIIIAPASNVISVARQSKLPDYSNYNEVIKYYNLPE